MSYAVQFAPEALDQLDAIEDYIASAGYPLAAARYVDAIVEYCESLAMFPERGIRRDDLMAGLRITNHRRQPTAAWPRSPRSNWPNRHKQDQYEASTPTPISSRICPSSASASAG